MAEASLKLGGSWATKEGSLLGFNDQNGNYKPIPFDFTRATTATRVNRNGLIEEVQSGVPRIDFTGDGSLLLEPQRTNLITYSEDISGWSATNVVLTQNTITAPDGLNTADKMAGTSVLSQHRVNFTSTNTSGATTFSFFAKSAEYNSCWARIGVDSAYFDLENGQSQAGTGINSSIEDYGNGWYRCILTKASSIANEVCRINLTTAYVETSDFVGDNTSGIYIWGGQHEQGSYATSYIPTEGSAVTRNVDVCSKTGFQGVSMNATQGTILMHIDNPYALGGNNDFHMFRANGSSGINDGWLFRCNTGTTIDLLERVGGSTGAQASSLATKDQINKIAWSFNASTFLISVNGITKSYTGTYNGTQIDIDEFTTSGSNLQGLEIINMQFFETALTQDELNALTTL